MEFKVIVLITSFEYDATLDAIVKRIHSFEYSNLQDALSGIDKCPYPAYKISIHLLTH